MVAHVEPNVEVCLALMFIQAEASDRNAVRIGQVEQRPWHDRTDREALNRLNRCLCLDQAIDVRPIKDAVTVEWKASSDRIVVAEKCKETRGRQLFCARQAAQFGAVDLTDEETRFPLGNGPLPSFGSHWHAAEARYCRPHFSSPLRPQADGGERQIHQAIAKFRHALAQAFRNLIVRQRGRRRMIALPDHVRPELSFGLLRLGLRGWLIEPSETTRSPTAYFFICMICQPLQNRTPVCPAPQFLHDLRAVAREPVLSSDMLGRFCRLDTLGVSLRKFCCAQLRKLASP